MRRSRRPQHRSEPPTPLFRSELSTPLPRSELPTSLLRSELPTPFLRSEPPTPRPFSARSHLRLISARRRLRPFSWGLGTHRTPHQRPYRFGSPTATAGHTYQHPPPQFPPIPTGGHLPPSTQPPMAPSPARLSIPSWHSTPTPSFPPPTPPRATTPGRGRDTIDLPEDVTPPPPPRPVYQSHPFHPSIMDETGLFSKETQHIVDRFVTDIDRRDLSRRCKGVVNPETVTSLDMTNNPVIFADQFRAGFAGLPPGELPVDQPGRGDQPSVPVKDERTPFRVTVFLRLFPLPHQKAHEQNAVVTVPTIDNSQVCRPSTALTATDLLRVFVYEVTEPGQSKITALVVRKQLHLLPGESWMPAAHRTLMHTTAASIQYYKSNAMEETYY